jgi:hypothetical protein
MTADEVALWSSRRVEVKLRESAIAFIAFASFTQPESVPAHPL